MAPRHWFTGGIVAALCALSLTPLITHASAQTGDTAAQVDNGYAHAGAPPGAKMSTLNSTTISSTTYPISGIDISSHDHSVYPMIDWASLAASGVKFAYVKAAEGTGYLNPYFAKDFQDARNAGLYVGAYVYGRPDDGDPVGQANYFVNNSLWTDDSRTLIPFLDIEWPWDLSDACYTLTPTQMTTWIRAFLNQVESRIGRKPMIYTAASWWNQCTNSDTSFGDYPLDVANYGVSAPTLPAGWLTWKLWQYAGGHNSQQGNDDKDVVNGDANTLAQLAGSRAPTVVSLRAHANGRFVNADPAGTNPLINTSGMIGAKEQYDLVPLSDGYIALRSHANGRYVTAESSGTKPLIANRLQVGVWERFSLIYNTDRTLSLRAHVNNRYVWADPAGAQPLIANSTTIGTAQKFDWVTPPATVTIKARSNSLYVTAPSSTQSLIADHSTAGTTERYDLIRLSRPYVALRAHGDGRYVTAESAGTKPLLANRSAIGTWETFKLVTNSDGTYSLLAMANHRYVTAAGSTSPLIANSTSIGTAQKFTIA
jgi:GH25 family lysozyme M1 (1,4-beta-N-acetylmuramidase)